MSEQTPGIELFLTSEKAVAGADKFRAAVEACAQAVERIGAVSDKLDATLDKLGKSATTAATPIRQMGGESISMGKQIGETATAAEQLGRKLDGVQAPAARAVRAQNAIAAAGRTVASVLRILEVTPAARVLGGVSEAMNSAGTASRGFSALLGATPWATIITLAGAATAAFFAFGGSAEESGKKARRMTDDLREAEAIARRFDELRLSIEIGESGSGRAFVAALKKDLAELNDELRRGTTQVPIERLLGAIEHEAPDTVVKLRKVNDEIVALGTAGKEIPDQLIQQFGKLGTEIEKRFGVQLKTTREKITESAFSPANAARGLVVDVEQAIAAVGKAYEVLAGKANAAKAATDAQRAALRDLQGGKLPAETKTDGSADRERASAMDDLIRSRTQELALVGKTGDELDRARLVQETLNALQKDGRDITFLEFGVLTSVLARKKQILGVAAEQKRTENVAEILAGLERQNDLLKVQGAERTALQKKQETLLALDKVKGGATEEERKQIEAAIAQNRELLALEEERLRLDRRPKLDRQAEFLRSLEQEEQLLKRTGKERERYRIQIEIENENREKGLRFTKDEIALLVKKKIALHEVSEAQQAARAYGEQFGETVGSALERLVFEGQKFRDVMRQLANDLARQAFRQTVTGSLGNAFGSMFASLAGGGGGGASAPSTPSAIGAPSPGSLYPEQRGGVIPAMGGQVIDNYSFLFRGGRKYSVAEGGKTTPEAIFPLARDSQGRLGVVGSGGGGDTIHMSFPAVRTAQDARAMRATLGQKLRQLRDADRRGRRGLRPRE